MKKQYYIVATLVFIYGIMACSNQLISVRKNPNISKASIVNPYSDYWSSIYCGMPELSSEFILDSEKTSLSDALLSIKNNQYLKATNILKKLSKSQNDTILTAARRLLNALYFRISDWKACDSLYRSYSRGDAKNPPIYLDYANLPAEKFTWSKDADSAHINIISDLPLVPVAINGHIYYFLLDTGCDITCISVSIAEELALKHIGDHPSSVMNSLGEYFNIYTAALDSISCLALKSNNHPVIIVSDNNLTFNNLSKTTIKLDGILGWNFLQNALFTLDYKYKRIIVEYPQKKIKSKNNFFWLGCPIAKLTSEDGIDLHFIFDTGDQSSNFFNLFVQKTRPTKITKSQKRAIGVGSNKLIDINIIAKTSILFDNYYLDFSKFESSVELTSLFICFDGRLGCDFLKNSRTTIDPINNEIIYYNYNAEINEIK
jgi:hypothetical protein